MTGGSATQEVVLLPQAPTPSLVSHQKNVGLQGSPLCPSPAGPVDTERRGKCVFGKKPWGLAHNMGMRRAKHVTNVKEVTAPLWSCPVCTASFL